ncbi:MAG TPA: hypothetical protein VHA75_07380, partial [Rugosimonospora sp.]|nr:hypothetical protein [Rugosimonospora sp.]
MTLSGLGQTGGAMRAQTVVAFTLVAALAGLSLPGGEAGAADPAYRTAQFVWKAAGGGFDGWDRGAGTARAANGQLVLDPASAQAASDAGG